MQKNIFECAVKNETLYKVLIIIIHIIILNHTKSLHIYDIRYAYNIRIFNFWLNIIWILLICPYDVLLNIAHLLTLHTITNVISHLLLFF